MIVNNPVSNDMRVKREALALKNAGFDIRIVGIHEQGWELMENWNGIEIIRIKLLTFPFADKTRERKVTDAKLSKNNNSSITLKDTKEKFGWLRFFISMVRYGIPIVKDCLSFNPHAIHSHDLDVMGYASVASLLSNAFLIYDSHEIWVEWKRSYNTPDYMVKTWEFIERLAIKKMSFMITVSEPMKDFFVKKYGLERKKIIVVRNCTQPKNCIKNRQIWGKAGIPTDKPIILHQGLIKKDRGILEIIEAAKLLPDLSFVFIGPIAPYYRPIFNSLPLNVYWIDFVEYEKLINFTCNADIGIVMTQPANPSYANGLSNKIFDYMAVGLPVVASSVKSHILIEKETGSLITVDPYNPHEIAEAIQKILSDSELRKKMSENGLKWVKQKYNTKNETQKLVAKYRELL